MTERAAPSTDAGFTLAEMLIALFVIAVLSVTGASTLSATLRASDRVDVAAERVRELTVMHALLREDIGAMTRRPSIDPDGFGLPAGPLGTVGEREGLIIGFVRGGWANLETDGRLRSDLQRIEYAFEGGALVRRAWLAPDPAERTPMVERRLVEGLSGLSLRYRNDGVWDTEWTSGAGGPGSDLPDLVELTLSFQDGDTLVMRFMTGDLPA